MAREVQVPKVVYCSAKTTEGIDVVFDLPKLFGRRSEGTRARVLSQVRSFSEKMKERFPFDVNGYRPWRA
jgi:hypothetical protein